jgi:MFS transporter, MFS domain-containing protein family, molybdate-anion transporter
MIFGVSLAIFYAISIGLLLLARRKAPTDEQQNRAEFVGFQRSYLVVYCLAVAGDWLQGPHVYALYQSYGMSKHQIGEFK